MEYLGYFLYLVLGILIIIGIKENYDFLIHVWFTSGFKAMLFWLVLFLLFMNILAAKQWYPHYYEDSKSVVYTYIVIGLIYNFLCLKNVNEDA